METASEHRRSAPIHSASASASCRAAYVTSEVTDDTARFASNGGGGAFGDMSSGYEIMSARSVRRQTMRAIFRSADAYRLFGRGRSLTRRRLRHQRLE